MLLNYNHIDDPHFDNCHIDRIIMIIMMIIALFRSPQNPHLGLGQTTSDHGLSHQNTIFSIVTIIIIVIIIIIKSIIIKINHRQVWVPADVDAGRGRGCGSSHLSIS